MVIMMPSRYNRTPMQRNVLNDRLVPLLTARPTVGGLMELCEANFALIQQLCPGLKRMRGEYESRPAGVARLHLTVVEQTAYTTLLRLTHLFSHEPGLDPDPDASLRIYRDARQVEVLELRQSVLPLARLYAHPGLEQKWRANLFVSRWLQFCLAQGHCFAMPETNYRRGGSYAVAIA